jgi:hypothetical protein
VVGGWGGREGGSVLKVKKVGGTNTACFQQETFYQRVQTMSYCQPG